MHGDAWIGNRSGKSTRATKPNRAPKATAKVLSGDVVSIDAAKNGVVIEDDAGVETHLMIGTITKITREGKAIALGDVKVGDRVATECEQSADGCKAKSLAVIPPAPNK